MKRPPRKGEGRPTDYSQETLVKTKDYFDNYEKYGDVMPSIAGLAIFLGTSRDTLYDWAKQEEKKEFSDMLREILTKQESVLFNKGLKGEFNSNITKLALTKHGYTDKSDLTSGDKPLNTLLVQFVDEKDVDENSK